MKKSVLILSAFFFASMAASAQKNAKANPAPKQSKTTTTPATTTTTQVTPVAAQAVPGTTTTNTQNPDQFMKFKTDDHNFGNIPEGPSVSVDFEFENTGKEPIVLSGVQASCGCTTPTWTKEPVLKGGKGKITATYSTQGRPGNFVKTITVNSNVGTKVLKISGNVEKAPDASVPADNGSIMKH